MITLTLPLHWNREPNWDIPLYFLDFFLVAIKNYLLRSVVSGHSKNSTRLVIFLRSKDFQSDFTHVKGFRISEYCSGIWVTMNLTMFLGLHTSLIMSGLGKWLTLRIWGQHIFLKIVYFLAFFFSHASLTIQFQRFCLFAWFFVLLLFTVSPKHLLRGYIKVRVRRSFRHHGKYFAPDSVSKYFEY